jgi:hypothetical protein
MSRSLRSAVFAGFFSRGHFGSPVSTTWSGEFNAIAKLMMCEGALTLQSTVARSSASPVARFDEANAKRSQIDVVANAT